MSTLDVNDCAPQLPPHSHDHSYQLTFERMIEEHKNLKLQVKELTDRIQAMSLKRAFTLEDIIIKKLEDIIIKALCCANTSQGNGSINQCTSVRWKEGADLEATWSISEHYDLFLSYVENQLYTQEDVDNCVANFSKTLCKIMKPYCIITGGLANTVTDAERCIDKPWFNDICKSKYRDYRGALHNFNVCKSDVNRIVLCAKKRVYKKNSPEV